MRRRDLLACAAAGPAIGLEQRVALGADGAWPNRPLRILVPVGPGSGPDVRARWLAERLAPMLGQPVTIDYRIGAGGKLAMGAAARSAPDGYSLVMTGIGLMVLDPFLYERLDYDAQRDFVLITRVGVGPLLLLVSPARSVQTVRDLVQASRARASSYGTPGAGTPQHVVSELFLREAHIDATHVPYTSPMQRISDLIGGDVQWLFEGTQLALPMVRAGRLRPLAVTSDRRLKALPDVPTMNEAGFAQLVFESWTALAVPAATPAEVVERLYRECARVLGTEEAVTWFGAVGNLPGGESPETAARILVADRQKWGGVIRAAGIRAER